MLYGDIPPEFACSVIVSLEYHKVSTHLLFMVDEGPLYSGVKPKTLTHEHAVRQEDLCISILRISTYRGLA